MIVIFYIFIGLTVLNYMNGHLSKDYCMLCRKKQKVKHLDWHYIIGLHCSPDCITREFLNISYEDYLKSQK